MLETVFHLGVHRCATTSFQAYLDQNTGILSKAGIVAWTPQKTRSGLFSGLVRPPEDESDRSTQRQLRAAKDIAIARADLAGRGLRHLIVSEENMIGTPRDNLARGGLYPDLTKRLARFVAAFDGKIDRIGLCIRSYEHYWSSVLAFSVASGGDVPDADQVARLAVQPRRWSHIVNEVATVVPDAKIDVWTFEAFAGRSRRQFNMLTGRVDVAAMLDQTPNWKNVSRNCNRLRHVLRLKGHEEMADRLPRGSGNWMPFDTEQCAAMRAHYAQDKVWLKSAPNIQFTELTAIKVLPSKDRRLTGPDPNGGHHEPQKTMV